ETIAARRSGPASDFVRETALRLDPGRPGPESEPDGDVGAGRDRRGLPGDDIGSTRAAPVQADHSDSAGRRLWEASDQAGIEPRAEAPGHRTQRARKDARAADLSHDPQRLPGTVRDLRGRPDVEPDFGPGQGDRPLCGKAGKRGRRKEQWWSKEALR